MAHTREERYAKIRAWLGYPKEQKPNPHQIFNQITVEEQSLLNRLTNTGKAWQIVTYTLTTVAGTAEYTLAFDTRPASDEHFGKVFDVVRATGNAEQPYVKIPFDDLDSLDFGKLPTAQDISVNEKISFYRTGSFEQNRKAVIQPVPQEVLTYICRFYVGTVDRIRSILTNSSAVTEVVDYIDLRTAIALLPYAEWEGKTDEQNDMTAKKLASGLLFQLENLERITNEYLKNINAPQSFEMSAWND